MLGYVNSLVQEVRLVDEAGAEEGGFDQAERGCQAVAEKHYRPTQAREARERQLVSVKRPEWHQGERSRAASHHLLAAPVQLSTGRLEGPLLSLRNTQVQSLHGWAYFPCRAY